MKTISLILVALVMLAAPVVAQNQHFTLPKFETGTVGYADVTGSQYTASATHYSAWFNGVQYDSVAVYFTSKDSVGVDAVKVVRKHSLNDTFQADTSAALSVGHLNSAVNAGKFFTFKIPASSLGPYNQLQYTFGADSIGTSDPYYKVTVVGYQRK